MPFMEHGNFRLYYEDSGGNKPAMLFLHGAGGNHLSWWQQVPVFAADYRCITVDQRSFGQSPDVPNGPGCAALASDALALLDHLRLERVAVVAQSMGGWAAVGAGSTATTPLLGHCPGQYRWRPQRSRDRRPAPGACGNASGTPASALARRTGGDLSEARSC